MTAASITVLFVVAVVAVLSPVLAELTGPLRVPAVVLEIGLGIIVGPHVLGLARPDSLAKGFSDLGLAFLMFLAGYELDLSRIRGRPLRLATTGWLFSLALGLAAGFVLVTSGLALNSLVVGLTLTTTALGTLLPVLRDAGVLESRFGALVMAVGTVGEFAPIVAVAVLLDHKDPLETGGLLVGFVAIAVTTVLLAARPLPSRLRSLLDRHLHSSGQLPIRVAMLFVVGLVFVAFHLGLDVLLGAFSAGIVARFFSAGPDSAVISQKLEAIGFGFLIPIFFVVSGMSFDGSALVDNPTSLLRVPLFLLLFLVVRGAPVVAFYRSELQPLPLRALALFSATGLPLIVVITTIGTAEGRMTRQNAAALVAAGMLSVLVYPLLGLVLLRRSEQRRRQLA